MRLTRETGGNWGGSKNYVGQDLSSIQKAIDDIEQELAALRALTNTLDARTSAPSPIIAPNGRVSTFAKKDGAPSQGFGGGVIIDPASGLAGQGILSDPLRASIDNSTVTFNSSGQLQGVVKKVTIPTAAVSTWLFGLSTTPRTLVAASAGVTHVPIFCAIYAKITGNGGSYTNGGATLNLHYINSFGTLPWGNFGGSNLALNTAVVSPAINRAFIRDFEVLNTNGVGNATFTAVGKPILLVTSADISGGSNAVAGLTLLYIDVPDAVF